MDESNEAEELTLEPVTVVRSRRPRALWGVLAAVAVATGALVITSAGDDGRTRPGLPVALGSAGRDEANGAMSADSMLAWITYVAGDDLPALGGEAPAYRLSGSIDEQQVRALAEALGVDGEVVHEDLAWRVSGDGGMLEVYEGGGAQWWYSSTFSGDGAAGSGGSGGATGGGTGCAESSEGVVTDCGVATSPSTTYLGCGVADGSGGCVTSECPPNAECVYPEPPVDARCAKTNDSACPDDPAVQPAPPVDLPSEEEARVIALDLLADAGLDVDGSDVAVDGPYDAWYVMVEPRIDGLLSGLLASVSVGSEGQVTSAGGSLGTPERLGDYPVLDTRAAIDRANAQQGGGGVYRDGVAIGEPVPAECEACVTTMISCPDQDPDCGNVGIATSPPATTTVVPMCKVQPDGSEICETVEPGVPCPPVSAPGDEPLGAPEMIGCPPPVPDPGGTPVPLPEPLPEPQPLEIVLVDAEPSLVLLGAIDGSSDAYLVPGYRFTDADGGRVDLPAVADDSLTEPPTTETTVPDTIEPPVTVPPQPCGDVLVEEDPGGTTHTVQPYPGCIEPEPVILPEGEQPQPGIAYYVDVDVECAAFELGGQIWRHDVGDLLGFSLPHEGGTFTLDASDHGTFIGDAEGDKTATFVTGTDPEGCQPTKRA